MQLDKDFDGPPAAVLLARGIVLQRLQLQQDGVDERLRAGQVIVAHLLCQRAVGLYGTARKRCQAAGYHIAHKAVGKRKTLELLLHLFGQRGRICFFRRGLGVRTGGLGRFALLKFPALCEDVLWDIARRECPAAERLHQEGERVLAGNLTARAAAAEHRRRRIDKIGRGMVWIFSAALAVAA